MRFMPKAMPGTTGRRRRTFRDLIREYRLTKCSVPGDSASPGSPMVGTAAGRPKLRKRTLRRHVNGALNAGGAFGGLYRHVNGVSEFRARDVLLIDMSAAEVDLREFCAEQLLEPMVLRGEYFSDQALTLAWRKFAYSGV